MVEKQGQKWLKIKMDEKQRAKMIENKNG